MFNAIFLACWSELQESQQTELADSLQQALTTQNIPEITQTLLNLAEFMEHSEKVCINLFSISLQVLKNVCDSCILIIHFMMNIPFLII